MILNLKINHNIINNSNNKNQNQLNIMIFLLAFNKKNNNKINFILNIIQIKKIFYLNLIQMALFNNNNQKNKKLFKLKIMKKIHLENQFLVTNHKYANKIIH